MTCANPNHNGNQGRACLCSTQASRAIFGLPPLHQDDGGHTFNAGVSFPIEREYPDEPVTAPEADSAWACIAQVAFIAIAVAALCFAFIQIVLPPVNH